MPSVFDAHQFDLQLDALKIETKERFITFYKAIALDLMTRILMRTPVDKGFLRGAWTPSVGSPSNARAGKFIYSGQTGDAPSGNEVSQLKDALGQLRSLGDAGDLVVYFSNALPYAEVIEYEGHSQQAPAGMVRVSIFEVLQQFG